MKIVDANIVLRYLLNDHKELSDRAQEIIENENVYLPNEVVAEITYVLEKVYKIENKEISKVMIDFIKFNNVEALNKRVLIEAFKLFGKRKFDFVDTILFGYNKVENIEIKTFDKKLNKLLDK